VKIIFILEVNHISLYDSYKKRSCCALISGILQAFRNFHPGLLMYCTRADLVLRFPVHGNLLDMSLKGRYHLEHRGVNGTIIWKWISKK